MKDVPSCPGYAVTRDGRVYSKKAGRFLDGYTQNGYVRIYVPGRKTSVGAHRMVAEAFLIIGYFEFFAG